ncbi:MAG TPA: DUF4346 domain-containing protein [Thermomicrobiales bacterium]|nr:DUF4346 domain-containing protein [Thermomicrobiales bacterium]
METGDATAAGGGREQPAAWPAVDGSYIVGDPAAPVAVCALTSDELPAPLAAAPGVAIAGTVQTANLGLERIVLNVTANPAIRFLLLCGKDSPLFRPGQSLAALLEGGVDAAGRIVGAEGYEPVLRNVAPARVAAFRRQVELADWTEERDPATLRERITGLAARNPGRFAAELADAGEVAAPPRFVPLRPGGRREPLAYDPDGYFVLALDRAAGQVVVRHYRTDHTPAHEMRGRTAESLLLGLLREHLVSQLSHAGYLGAELAKAETALRLGLRYTQDRPLRREEPSPAPTPAGAPLPASAPAPPPMPMTLAELRAAPAGATVNVTVVVTAVPADGLLAGVVGEPGAGDPFRAVRRTAHPLRVRWGADTKVVMGKPDDIRPGALLRVRGTLHPAGEVAAEGIAIITRVATIEGEAGAAAEEAGA